MTLSSILIITVPIIAFGLCLEELYKYNKYNELKLHELYLLYLNLEERNTYLNDMCEHLKKKILKDEKVNIIRDVE